MVACVLFNQAEFLKIKGKQFFHFQTLFDNLCGLCVTYGFEFFALPALHLACCDYLKIMKVAKANSKGGFERNEKKLKLAWKAKVTELKNQDKVKYPSALKLIELLFPLHK